jgi:excisionase family DNA binding protein
MLLLAARKAAFLLAVYAGAGEALKEALLRERKLDELQVREVVVTAINRSGQRVPDRLQQLLLVEWEEARQALSRLARRSYSDRAWYERICARGRKLLWYGPGEQRAVTRGLPSPGASTIHRPGRPLRPTTSRDNAMTSKHFHELPDVLNPAQVAHFLGLSRNTVYQNLRTGAIPSIKIGRRALIPKAALRRLLEGGEMPA